jgi:type VI secretion system secreted protein Hcp
MALMAYARLRGHTQGEITGSILTKGFERSIGVVAVSHGIEVPVDPQTGAPIGRREHKAFTFTKDLDQSTPRLLQALVSNETLTTAKFEFLHPAPGTPTTGVATSPPVVFTVEMTNATVKSYKVIQADFRVESVAKLPVYEVIELCYQSITWTWLKGGIAAGDSWTAG